MIRNVITVIVNVIYVVVLNMNLYTDRAMMPDGGVREWHRSPISRLAISDQSVLLYIQLAFVVISVITSILLLFGVRRRIIKTVQCVSTIASTAMFIIILIVTGNTHVKYA